jgi:hypothetical protein
VGLHPAQAVPADAIVEENSGARLDGLRASLSIMALVALVALFFTRIPTRQSSAEARSSGVGDGRPSGRGDRRPIPVREGTT